MKGGREREREREREIAGYEPLRAAQTVVAGEGEKGGRAVCQRRRGGGRVISE